MLIREHPVERANESIIPLNKAVPEKLDHSANTQRPSAGCSQRTHAALVCKPGPSRFHCARFLILQLFPATPTLSVTKSRVGAAADGAGRLGLCLLTSRSFLPRNPGPEHPAVQLGPRRDCFSGV